jgi:serine/threonine-protein kinase
VLEKLKYPFRRALVARERPELASKFEAKRVAQLGKYQLVAEIARGGMGIVYLAVDRGPARFSKLLVVKQLKPELVEDSNFLDMFMEEARLAARLSHPNIVQTYEIGSDGDRHYMVMDYLEGVTLSRILRRKNPKFTLAMHLRVICEALAGLHYAHTLTDFDGTPLGIVHRDATPQNVFVTYDGQVKLVDFGIAKALDSTVETSAGVLKGKPSYMAPEQIAGDVDPRADVFSAGVMVWEAVAGRRMWDKRGDVEILTHIIKGDVPSLKDAVPTAPPPLLRIVEKALQRSRDDRYASAAELQQDIEAYLAATSRALHLRDVGKVATEMYGSERASLKAMIENHLAGIKAGTEQAKLPSLRPPRTHESSNEVSAIRESTATVTTGVSESSLTPSVGKTPPGMEIPITPPRAERGALPHRNVVIATAIMLVAIVMAGFGVAALRRGDAAQATAAAAERTSPTVAEVQDETPTSPPSSHDLTVRAFPKNSVMTVDGSEVSNPMTRTCAHGKAFTVHVSSPGLVSVDRTIDCRTDGVIEIALTAQPASTPPPPASAPAKAPVVAPAKAHAASVASPPAVSHATESPPHPSAPTEVIPAGATKPNRPIDTSSPYSQ